MPSRTKVPRPPAFARHLAFAALALLIPNACSPARLKRGAEDPRGAQNTAAPPVPEPPPSELRLPLIVAPDSLIAAWLGDLQRPRLNGQSGLSVSCSADDASILHSLKAIEALTCSEILASVLRFPPGVTLSCPNAQTLQARLTVGKCSRLANLRAIAGQLLMPPGWGIYRDSPKGEVMWPNLTRYPQVAAGLLPLRQVDARENQFVESPLDLWLSNSAPNGTFALGVNLAVTGPDTEAARNAFRALVTDLRQSPKPKKFAHLNVEGGAGTVDSPTVARVTPADPRIARKNEQVYFFAVQTLPKDPLLRSVCTYVDNWIRAQQLLRGHIPDTTASRKAEISCQFTWADEAPAEHGMRLTRLPLPLMLPSSQLFPIKTIDEARSVAVLQSLKVMK